MPGIIRATLAALLLSGGAVFAQGGVDKKYYTVSISGFPIGHVEYQSQSGEDGYRVQGFLGSSGFFGFFIGTRYSGAVIGETRGGKAVPEVFRGRFEARGKYAQVDVSYKNAQPASVVHQPARASQPYDIPLKAARNSVDPISALYLLLRDVDRRDVCRFDQTIFDGVRLSRVFLGAAAVPDGIAEGQGRLQCNGAYSRVGGFSEDQLADRTDYPFLLEYAQKADGSWHVSRFLATTDFGIAKAQLRNR